MLSARNHKIRQLLLGLSLGIPVAFATAASGEAAQRDTDVLLAINEGEASLGILDPRTGRELAKVVEGAITGHEVAASADGRLAYVPIYGDSSVGEPGSDGQELVVIDIASRKVVNRLDFGHGVRPHCVLLNPHDGMLYVTTEVDHTVTVIDPGTLKIVDVIPTGQSESHMLALSHDGRFGYTSNVGPGTVSVLDIKARSLVTIIPVSRTTQRISISMDDKMVFTADQTKPRLAVIDTATNSVKTWIPLPSPGYGSTPTHDGRWLLVAMQKTSQVAVIDLKTLQVVRTIDVPPAPHEILISPTDDVAYVSCSRSGKIAAIRLSDWTVRLIDGGNRVDGLAWAQSHLFS
ncbi:MAG: beta-propeller fold lactonase family protein, partial [Deltaproteobacteria bacterium]|nr:beta-propeller fold lactonase family protein [Deltaproteobacteria bacterium]